MAAITASMVAELRAKTDAPMMECKKALTEADGDMAKAVTLYARGMADAVLEGKANAVNDVVKAVQAAEGDDEFVEVEDENAA